MARTRPATAASRAASCWRWQAIATNATGGSARSQAATAACGRPETTSSNASTAKPPPIATNRATSRRPQPPDMYPSCGVELRPRGRTIEHRRIRDNGDVHAAIVSFRLGGPDGVSVEARKWQWALQQLGFSVRTVAGEGAADLLVPGLAIGAPDPPTATEVAGALDDVDLVVVENLCSL